MTTLRCERYPHMLVLTQYGKVRFTDGLAEVTDEQAEVLLNMPKVYGIALDDGDDEEPVEDPVGPLAAPAERPPQSAPKADWVAYANAQDEAVDHSSMTKQELIEKFGG